MTVQAAPAPPPLIAAENLAERPQRTLWGDAWAKFRKNRLAIFGLITLSIIVLGVLLGPVFYRVDPRFVGITQDLGLSNLAPTRDHPFGTDDVGRDMLANNLHGGRISLAVGISAMLVSIILGTLVGLLAGFFKRLDTPLMRITDIALALPRLPLLLVITLLFRDTLRNAFGPERGIFLLIVFVIGILGWMPTARIVRGSVLGVKEKEFVEAAHNIGTRDLTILSRHILPNVLSPIIVSATLTVAASILTESALSFLGLGFPPDVPTWGSLLFANQNYISNNPWLLFFPGLLISLTILSINFMGDGLRDALDPKSLK